MDVNKFIIVKTSKWYKQTDRVRVGASYHRNMRISPNSTKIQEFF